MMTPHRLHDWRARLDRITTADMLGGITLAAVAIPECMGYTKIVGTPVVTGLYTILLPVIAFAWLGSSRHLVVGADSATAAILFAGLSPLATPFSPHWLTLTSAAALATAVPLIAAALLRLGFLSNFMSRTVLVGFLGGVGVSLVIRQIPEMLGLEVQPGGFFPHLIGTVTHVRDAHLPTVLMTAGVLTTIVGTDRWLRGLPGALVAVVLAIIVTATFGLDRMGIALVGSVQPGLPTLSIPRVSGQEMLALLPTVTSMFLVIVAQSAATSRSLAQKYGEPLNEDRDLLALGVSNALAGVSGAFVVNGSPTKTAIVAGAGARSQIAQLTMAAVVLLVLIVATRVIAWLPVAALAALVFVIGVRLVDVGELRQIYRFRKLTFAVALATLGSVVVSGVARGMFVAIVLSVFDHLRQEYKPTDVLLTFSDGRLRPARANPGVETEPGLLVYRFDAPLFFANADRFAARVQSLAAHAPHPVRWFVFDLVSVSDIDYTAGRALAATIRQLQKDGILVVFTETDDVREDLERVTAIHDVRADRAFDSVVLAIDAFHEEIADGGNSRRIDGDESGQD
jgi:SulP family sulfate permease